MSAVVIRRGADPEGHRCILDVARLIVPGDARGGLLGLFTAYFDESGSHQGSRWLAVGGFVGRADAWATFEAKWHALRACHGMGSHLHTKTFRKRYDSWDPPRRDRFMMDFGLALRGAAVCGCVSVLDVAAYNEVFS